MSNPTGLSLTVPATFAVSLHGQSATVSFPVRDSGTVPVTVTFAVENVSARTQAHPASKWVTSVSPATVHLRPGQAENVRLSINTPPGASGTAYTNLVATATGDAHGQVVAHGATASLLAVTAPRSVTPVNVHGGVSPLVAVVPAVLVSVTVLGLIGRRLLRHGGTRGTRRTPSHVAHHRSGSWE
jgi:hypothetical protein